MSPSARTSSAPPSAAVSVIVSSSTAASGTVMMPLRSNIQATEPGAPSEPPYLPNAKRTSAAVRLRLSVSASTISAAPLAP